MKKSDKAKTNENLKEKIQIGYMDYVLTEGKEPASVYSFSKNLGIDEGTFYAHFNSFNSIATSIWEDLLHTTLNQIQSGEEYSSFPARDKVLAFFYTLVENLRQKRSYVSQSSKGWLIPGKAGALKSATEKVLMPFFKEIAEEGLATGELASRQKVDDYYAQALMVQFWFVLEFWLKDDSSGFEDTDAAIEKAVQLGFDVMKENTLDKAFDLARFLWSRSPLAPKK